MGLLCLCESTRDLFNSVQMHALFLLLFMLLLAPTASFVPLASLGTVLFVFSLEQQPGWARCWTIFVRRPRRSYFEWETFLSLTRRVLQPSKNLSATRRGTRTILSNVQPDVLGDFDRLSLTKKLTVTVVKNLEKALIVAQSGVV